MQQVKGVDPEVLIQRAKATLWQSGQLSFKLHSGQLEIYKTLQELIKKDHKEFAFRIARQYGKSYLTIILALEICLRHPGVIVRVLGATLDSIKNIVEDNIQPIIADAPDGLINRVRSEKRYTVGSSSLRIGTMERSHIDQTARGGNAFAIFCEECAASVKSEDLQYAMESVINPQLLRSSRIPGGGLLGFITTPADNPEHYFHSIIEPRLKKMGTLFTRTVYQNPQLSQYQIDLAIERCGGEESDAWRREYLCELFRSEDVVIIPEFDIARHVKPIILPKYKRLWTCIDFGGSKDHHHAVLYYWDFARSKMVIYREVHAYNSTSTVDLIKMIKDMESFDIFGSVGRWGDLPGQLYVDLNSTYHFCITQTAKDDRDSALTHLRNLFRLDLIEVSPECKHTIKALQAGRWNKTRSDFLRTEELGHCDAIDALLYASRNIDKADPKTGTLRITDDTHIGKNERRKKQGFEELAKMWRA